MGRGFPEVQFHYSRLYNVDGQGAHAGENPGLREFTGRAEHKDRVKAPSPRSIVLTSTNMRDGSAATLEAVIR